MNQLVEMFTIGAYFYSSRSSSGFGSSISFTSGSSSGGSSSSSGRSSDISGGKDFFVFWKAVYFWATKSAVKTFMDNFVNGV